MGEEVVGLEDDAHASAHGIQISANGGHVNRPITVRIEQDRARVDDFQPVDAPQQGRLPGSGRTNEGYDFMLPHLYIDATQHTALVKSLPHTTCLEKGRHCPPPAC